MKKITRRMLMMTMVIAALFAFSVGVSAADTVNASVNVNVQMGGDFVVTPMMFCVDSGIAEEFGYTDEVNPAENVSVLDVLVTVHEWYVYDDIAETYFTPENCRDYLDITSGGWVTKVLGASPVGFSFAVNGECPHSAVESTYGGYLSYLIQQAPVKSGDTVEFMDYQDTDFYSDAYVWFMDGANRVENVNTALNKEITLNLKGYSFMYYGAYGMENIPTYLSALDGAELAVYKADGTLTKQTYDTDSEGNVTLSFSEAGSYYVVASMPEASDTTIFMSVLPVRAYAEIEYSDMTDVAADGWYKDAVSEVLAKGIMNGTSPTTFAPDENVTRGQFVTILYRASNMPNYPWNALFTDVDMSEYYADAVSWAYDNGIVNGTSPTTFAPNEDISREQMAAMMARYAAVAGITLPSAENATPFADDAKISSYAKTPVYQLVNAKVINGIGGNLFAPQNTATRAQAAQVITKLGALK